MGIKKTNTYRIENDYMICECPNDNYFIFDTEDYDKIKGYFWNYHKNKVTTYINRKSVSLSKYLLNISSSTQRKILLRNGDPTDYRKQNLYYGNVYTKCNGYYIGECFNYERFYINVEDYDLIKDYVWHVDKNGYLLTKINGKSYKQHRLILGLTTSDNIEVDHINHNTLDNRRQNLRLVDRSQQCMNRRIGVTNSTGIKGVYKMSGYDGKWCAQINADGERIYLGSYNSLDEAKSVRNTAADKLHGEYKCE